MSSPEWPRWGSSPRNRGNGRFGPRSRFNPGKAPISARPLISPSSFGMQMERKYGKEILYQEGLRIYTTLDLSLQRAAQRAMETGLRDLDKRQGFRGPLRTLSSDELRHPPKKRGLYSLLFRPMKCSKGSSSPRTIRKNTYTVLGGRSKGDSPLCRPGLGPQYQIDASRSNRKRLRIHRTCSRRGCGSRQGEGTPRRRISRLFSRWIRNLLSREPYSVSIRRRDTSKPWWAVGISAKANSIVPSNLEDSRDLPSNPSSMRLP